jgi:hypothetical protein
MQQRVRKTTIGLTGVALASGLALAETPPATQLDVSAIDLSQFPTENVGTQPILVGLNNAADIPATLSTNYGFSEGITPQQGSFRLGVLMADLQVAANAADKARTLVAAEALLNGLNTLGASNALVSSVTQLLSALHNDVSLQAVSQLAAPMLMPHIRAFIKTDGVQNFYLMGEWTETLSLLVAGRGEDSDIPIPEAKQAQDFSQSLAEAEAVPQGIKDALTTLTQIGQSETLNARQVQNAKKALNTLKTLFG